MHNLVTIYELEIWMDTDMNNDMDMRATLKYKHFNIKM